MATNVVMPKMGESITEGTVLRWLKKEGDAVQKDEPILEISTDKVDTEVPSPVAGTLLKILAQEKQTVSVGEPIASIGTNGEAAPAAQQQQKAPAQEQSPQQQVPQQQSPQQQIPQQQAPQPQVPQQQAPQPQVPRQQAPQQQASQQQAPQQQASQQTPAPSNGQDGQGQAVVMPKMGESIAEGTVLRWLKKEGDQVQKDEPILEISTDKVDTEVPAPFAGTLSKIVAKEKETVAVGATIAFISGGSAPSDGSVQSVPQPPPQSPQQQARQQPPQQQTPPPPQQQQQAPPPQQQQQESQPPTHQASAGKDNRFYSPLVKNIAKTEGISQEELSRISGSGMEGRVNKNDMLKYVESRKGQAGNAAPQQAGGITPRAPNFAPQAPHPMQAPAFAASGEATTILPMDNIRQRIAEHMVRSVHTSAHVTSISEVDVTNIVKYQKSSKESFEQRYGVRLTLTPIFVECMIKALREFPFINASIDGTNIVVRNEINFGIAVAMPKQEGSPLPPALIVPVIKHADRLSLAGLAAAVHELANKARTKKLTPDDISGGTFTLTNPGMFGNILSTPIINQPNLAIMTTGAIVKRPVVKSDEEGNDYIAIRSMMYLGLSHDHRLIDGLYAVQFTERVKQYMEAFKGDGI